MGSFGEMGFRPPQSAYEAAGSHEMGGTGEKEEDGEDDGFRMGGKRADPTRHGPLNGGKSPSRNMGNGRDPWANDRVGGGDGEIPRMRRQSVSENPIVIQQAINRYWGFREHIPFIRWETLSDSADSTYEPYVTGNPDIRRTQVGEVAKCSRLRDGPYFTPDPHEWSDGYHVGGKKGSQLKPQETTSESEADGFVPMLYQCG